MVEASGLTDAHDVLLSFLAVDFFSNATACGGPSYFKRFAASPDRVETSARVRGRSRRSGLFRGGVAACTWLPRELSRSSSITAIRCPAR